MIAQTTFGDFLPYGSLMVAVFVAAISGYFALKGKKLDAGQWITDTLQNDAEANRLEVKELEKKLEELGKNYNIEIEINKNKIEVLQTAVASLIVKEKELIAYISLLEKEINILKELLILQGAATPEMKISLSSVDITETMSMPGLENVIKDLTEKNDEN